MNQKTKIIILAAGKGSRMQSDLPKALHPVGGKPMIMHLLESVAKSGIDSEPVIVVGYKKELVEETLGKDKYHYVDQIEPFGTGHAVGMTREYLEDKADHVVVLYGDHPFVSSETIKKLAQKNLHSNAKITMAAVKLPDFRDWRINFVQFSRILRDEKGKIVGDVQWKDATDAQVKILEVNPCFFCFEAKWLWQNLEQLKNKNAQGEYYLTDLIKIAVQEGEEIESIDIAPHEALGANTQRELQILETLVQ